MKLPILIFDFLKVENIYKMSAGFNLNIYNYGKKELEDLLNDDDDDGDEKDKPEILKESNIILSINPMHISDDDSSSEKEGDQNIVI